MRKYTFHYKHHGCPTKKQMHRPCECDVHVAITVDAEEILRTINQALMILVVDSLWSSTRTSF